ncbi:hypothetical protein IJJ36_04170 [Candidatus Saccharibacteria bacterium]|nr:hypothetical protein [Candidatus Saccharibacteria bacterium]
MKRIKIVGTGLAVLGLAALPMPGTFAAVHTINGTVNEACGASSQAGGIFAPTASTTTGNSLGGDVLNGSAGEYSGAIYVSCNYASGWNIKAVGAQTSGTATSMAGSVSGTSIATGTTFSGGTSYWGFKLASSASLVTVASDFASYHAIPSTATKVASASGATSGSLITPSYKVWVSATQAAGSYVGKVTYTLSTGTGS